MTQVVEFNLHNVTAWPDRVCTDAPIPLFSEFSGMLSVSMHEVARNMMERKWDSTVMCAGCGEGYHVRLLSHIMARGTVIAADTWRGVEGGKIVPLLFERFAHVCGGADRIVPMRMQEITAIKKCKDGGVLIDAFCVRPVINPFSFRGIMNWAADNYPNAVLFGDGAERVDVLEQLRIFSKLRRWPMRSMGAAWIFER